MMLVVLVLAMVVLVLLRVGCGSKAHAQHVSPILVQLAHEPSIWIRDLSPVLDMPQCTIGCPSVLGHEVGRNDGNRAADALCAMYENSAGWLLCECVPDERRCHW
jgi:hypothetical protein